MFAAALAVAAWFIRREKGAVVAEPWEAVPADAFLIIETDDFPELLTRVADPAGLLSSLTAMEWASSLVTAASAVDSITGSREVRELISSRRVVISFHTAGQRAAAPLAVMSTGPLFTGRRLTALTTQTGATVSGRREIDGTRTFTATYRQGAGEVTIHMALTAGILIMTPSESLMLAALDNRAAGSDIRRQQGFTPVAGAAGKGSDNLFVLFRNLPPFLSSFVAPDEVTEIASVAVAGGGDLTVTEEGLYLSGFLTTAGTGSGADRLTAVVPAECSVHEMLPRSILAYRTVMRRATLTGETATDPTSINASDLALILSPYTGNEVTEALAGGGGGNEWIRVFHMSDRQSAEETLMQRLTARYRATRTADSQFMVRVRGAEGVEQTIYRVPFRGVSAILAGTAGRGVNDEWVTFVRSYMLFGGSPERLAAIVRESAAGNTLINDPQYRELEKTVPTKSAYLFYSSGEVIRSLLSGILDSEAAARLDGDALSAVNGIGVSLTPSNEMIYTSLSVRYSSGQGPHMTTASGAAAVNDSEAAADTAAMTLQWRVKLDAPPAIRPYLFTNHNTGATELFIQDQTNQIYLFSATGKMLWKAPVRERINGEIHMIDYYRNGKLQLLFAGREYLHLIDRNGNYVDRYPVKMRSPASNTLALFDYEGNKNYRLCIAGEDRVIYLYDRSGIPVRGWNAFTTRGRVTDPVSFFRVKGKDYLFVADDQALYLLDRTGNIRVAHEEPLTKAAGSQARLITGDEPAVIFSAPEGATVRLLFDGTVKRTAVAGTTAAHRSDFADIDGDSQSDRVNLDEGVLKLFDGGGNEIWSYVTGGDQLQGPVIFTMGAGEKRIGVYDAGTRMLHMTGAAGRAVNGFPREAGPYYTIGRLTNKTTWNLVINESDSYISNYTIGTGGR